ncbi:hypothetical protein OGY68_10220 [Citrobacter sp. Cpo065]|uniref:hypothetical protein n=1 Tax=Citrobacter sp. Cpo065 TaxID=2985131 RepID=UPI002574A5FD|nr:hypothetical protein [Citrobacter sp. Cpo065]MDM2853276.1 hypothetical protein [Citrobacter sp. Cpo065]
MSWQGVPFKLLEVGNVDQLLLKLSSLPKLTIDTPTDYNQLALTVGATFLGGIIPALIAWRTFHVNAKNVKKERQEQQKFLQTERAKQHIFMMGERSSQFSSLKEDRELQTSIAQRTINAQVISANRQSWIVDLRKNIADYCSAYFIHFDALADYMIIADIHEKSLKRYEKKQKTSLDNDGLKHVQERFNIRLETVRKAKNTLDSIKYNIFLMINDSEQDGLLVTNCVNKLNLCCLQLKINDAGEIENYNEKYSESLNCTSELIKVSKKLLKNEWVRVKGGG